MIETIFAASAAIFRADGKVLLAKRTKPPYQWSFPGGSLEPGESAAQAAIREAQEEVSVEIEIAAHAGEREIALGPQRYVISVFAARLISGEAKTGAEASEIGWFDVAEIASLDTTENLADYAERAKRLLFAT
jgi:8-oxo-dGTP diphosphatase